MSQRYLGGIITANPTAPTLSNASGVWTLEQQFQYSSTWSPEIIGNSLRFRSSASAYLNRTPSVAGNQRTWTWSGWVKRGTLLSAGTNGLFEGYYTTNNLTSFSFGNDALNLQLYISGSYNTVWSSTAVFRDPSAWYHVVLVFDTTQASQANMAKLYVNGVQQTFGYTNYLSAIPQNSDWYVNASGINQFLGLYRAGSPFDGYMAEVYFVDGQALTPSSFGAFDSNGVWQPLAYTGTFGTNGFYVDFSDNSGTTATTLGKDYSGNGNNWTPNNFSLTTGVTYDSMLDVPTPYADGGNGRGNYAVMSPIGYRTSTPTPTITDGNLTVVCPSSSGSSIGTSTFGVSSGKWYWEVTKTGGSYANTGVVLTPFNMNASSALDFGGLSNEYAYVYNGNKFNNNSASAYGASYTSNDVIGVALDLDAGTLAFYKNGVSQGTAFSSLPSGTYLAGGYDSYQGSGFIFNFGQRPFAYTPPTGFKALNTQNMPVANITNGAQYMAATLYTGTGSTLSIANTVNGVSMQPDFVWMKARNTTDWHYLIDAVRGGSKILYSNTTSVEATDTTAVQSFNSNGFTIGNNAPINTNANTYIGWQWQAGKGVTSSNTNGSITSTVSVNATAGFSVVTYTANGASAQTIGHGLGVAPSMIITKCRSAGSSNWGVYHKSIGNTGAVFLNATNATATSSLYWNNTSPTSTVFSVGSNNTDTNYSTNTMVAYCWAEVAGYSAFGSYTGNGSADGPFVYCGFRPRWWMIKRTDSAGFNWVVIDSSRDTYNVTGNYLLPNTSGAEVSAPPLFDFLSNGVKVRDSGTGTNASGGTYIFAAFAENPFQISRAR